MEIAALIISILALLLSLVQFLRDASRQKKEATLVAYNELQDDVFSHLNKFPNPMPTFEYLSKEWEEMTVYLAKIERFSVGVNMGIYSFDVLNRLGGAYFIRQYNKLEPIIKRKRQENISDGKHYDEFEKAVKTLKRLRGEKHETPIQTPKISS